MAITVQDQRIRNNEFSKDGECVDINGVKDAGQEGDAPKTTGRSGYNNEDDLHVWKDRYLRRNEDHSRRDAKTGGMSAPKEITFKYRKAHPK